MSTKTLQCFDAVGCFRRTSGTQKLPSQQRQKIHFWATSLTGWTKNESSTKNRATHKM